MQKKDYEALRAIYKQALQDYDTKIATLTGEIVNKQSLRERYQTYYNETSDRLNALDYRFTLEQEMDAGVVDN